MIRFVRPLAVLSAVTAASALSIVLAAGGRERPAATSDASTFELICNQTSVDNCGPVCPCVFGEEPHHGTCRFLALLEIERGHVGTVDVAGGRLAVLGEFSGAVRDKPPLDLTRWYVDGRPLRDEARRALHELVTLPAFTGKRSLGVAEEPLGVVRLEGGRRSIRVGDKGSFEIEPLLGPNGKPTEIVNPWSPFEELGTVTLGAAKGKFSDEGVDLEVERGSGELHRIRIAGPLATK